MYKPKAYIWDIDGTIAHRTGRSPFDWTRVSEDVPDENIKILYNYLRTSNQNDLAQDNFVFIFVTGRDQGCKEETEKWLDDNGFDYDRIFMRPEGNKEQDAILKMKIYREEIEPTYDVIAVFEDRGRCVEMYRNILKLTVLQVAEGRF